MHPSDVPDEVWSPQAGPVRPADVHVPGYRDVVLVAWSSDTALYRARQDGLDRPVAVKVLGPAATTAELETVVELGRAHPHLVSVLDTPFTTDGRLCVVMEYYELGSLYDQLRARGPLPPSAVVAAGTAVADGLAFAHSRQVLHSDVKPSNILALPTSYVLSDIGLARRPDHRHAAPQVLDGDGPTVADDIYSLGSTLYTLLDGRPPFATGEPAADATAAHIRRVRTEPPRPMRAVGVPDELVRIVNRCLVRRREDRFADATALRDALADVMTEVREWAPDAVAARSATTGRPPAREPSWEPSAPAPPSMPAPPPLALSALDLIPSRHRPDPAEPTGPAPDDADDDDEDNDDDDRPRGWPRLLVIAALALLLGGLVGVGGPWLLRQIRSSAKAAPPTAPAAPAEPTARPVPTFTGSLPSGATTAAADDRIAPVITGLDDRSNAVELSWVDRSGGAAVFVIVDVTGSPAVPLLQVDAGQTRVQVNGLDPKAARYCFEVLAVTADARGASDVRCTGKRP